jgi:chemotaxis protein CheX
VILSTERDVAEKVTEVMFDKRGPVDDDEIIDVIGELTNMVGGGAKAELGLANMCLALPAVIMGTDHCIALGSRVHPVLLPFDSRWGPLAVQFGFLEPLGQRECASRSCSEVLPSEL